MEFSWSSEQESLYARILRFAAERWPISADAIAATSGEADAIRHAEWLQCATIGLTGLCVSGEYGGLGLDGLATARALEAFGRGCHDAGLGFSLGAHLFACAKPLELYGTAAQKAQYLPSLCAGETVGCGAITERDSGSDVFSLKTTAVRDGSTYVLNGEKTFATNGPVADLCIVYASTAPQHGVMGLSAFLIERGARGMAIGEPFNKAGLTTAPVSGIRFEDCRVPDSARLGSDGAGAGIFQMAITWERCCLFALWLGAMDRQLDCVVQHARTRKQFGRPIGSNQAVSHRIADMKLRVEAARLLLYRACWELAQGQTPTLSSALSKIAVSDAFLRSSLDAVQLFGALGIVESTGIARDVRDALPGTIYSGTNEMQREIIARALGLPVQRRA